MLKEKSNELSECLSLQMQSRGFAKYRKNQFRKKIGGGWWYFRYFEKKYKSLDGIVISFQIGYHLDAAEEIAARLSNSKYDKNAVTGCFNNMGHLFKKSTCHEMLLTCNTIIEDVVDDIIYHYDKYAADLIGSFNSARELYSEIPDNNFLYSTLCSKYLQQAAVLLLAGRYSESFELIRNSPENYFSELPISKTECINNAEKLIGEYKNETVT